MPPRPHSVLARVQEWPLVVGAFQDAAVWRSELPQLNRRHHLPGAVDPFLFNAQRLDRDPHRE